MTYNRDAFFHALLHALDAPANDNTLGALHAWAECEGSDAEFNPLDTTWHEEGATPYNSFESNGQTMHVWNFPNEETGVRATVSTLEAGEYPHILAALKDGHGRILDGHGEAEMRTWGTNPDCIRGKLPKEKKDTTPQTDPVALTEETRAYATRLARHLEARAHRLTHDDKDRLTHLRTAVNHALKVK